MFNPDYVHRVKPERVLEQEHEDFLLSTATLNAWAGFTVKDRCALFQAEFKDKVIAPTALERFYRKHGVKRKRVRMIKTLSMTAQDNFDDNRQKILDKL